MSRFVMPITGKTNSKPNLEQSRLTESRARPGPLPFNLGAYPALTLSNACWTPSPDTSRVIEGLSDLRLILSTSSM